MSRRHLAALLPVVLLGAGALAAEVPYLSGRVNDGAEILGAPARQELTGLLREHEERTTNQIAVLTVSSLEGESVEAYASAVFKAWKLGQKGKDNGVLLLVAPSERRVRIEVGYGLEGTLTDLAAGRIIRNVVTPRFKQGDFDRGVLDGARAIVAALEGRAAAAPDEATPPARAEKRSDSFFEGPDLSLQERLLLGAFIFGIIGLFTVIGVLTPGVGWFLYFFLIPFWAMFPIVIVGVQGAVTLLVTYLVAFPIVKLTLSRTSWYEKARKDLATKGTARIGGFVLSGGGGSSGSSFSSSSSSFSGGGGSSGGGGASGSW